LGGVSLDEISYEVREADIVAFNDFHASSSATLKSTYRRNRYIWTLVAASLALVAWYVWHVELLAVYLGVFAAIWFFFSPRFIRRARQKQVKRMYAEGENKGTIGYQRLSIAPSSMTNSSDQGESRINWSAVERVEETHDHIFIYISALMALVIPRETASGADLSDFVGRVRRFVAAAQQGVEPGVE
jgi:hypothetical protein